MNGDYENLLGELEKEANRYYFGWFTVYFLLGMCSIGLPALAAMGITFGIENGAKYFAGFGALAAAAFGFFKPNEYAAAFDAAIAEVRSLRLRIRSLPEDEAVKRFDLIFHLMAFKYQGSIPGLQKTKSQEPVPNG